METAALARRRRGPFLAPIWLAMLLIAIAALVAFEVYQLAATTTVVVVWPAPRFLTGSPGTPLLPEEEQGAERLVRLFAGTASPGRIAALYVAATSGTRQAAAPLAARLGIEPIIVPAEDVEGTAARALSDHRGETVMIVSSAARRLVEALSGIKVAAPSAGDDGGIYIVSVPILGSCGLVQLHY